MLKKIDYKKLAYDIMIDVVAGVLIAIGVYNFAANSGFPLAGVSGLALIGYHLFHFPIGVTTMVLNIPIALGCYRTLGREFFVRSIRSVIITSVIVDVIAPLFPTYSGDLMLSAICTGIFSGLGYALIFTNNSSTGGMDFISMSIRAKNPHVSLGKITFIIDAFIVAIGGWIFRDVDATIYGFIISYLLSAIIDKLMYGIDSGKMTLIVTEQGQAVADTIAQYSDRGSTILRGTGSYSGSDKEVVMCACNNKQMYAVRKAVKKVDPKAFTVIMESNEVVGEGFKEE
ncbi:MAG: YitT family protein [Hespellia sp.]|nr:YitT family protein [Hespellia sp.]